MNNTQQLLQAFDRLMEAELTEKQVKAYYDRIDKREAEQHDITKSDMGVKKWTE